MGYSRFRSTILATLLALSMGLPLILALGGCSMHGGARPAVPVETTDFYGVLAPHGTWVWREELGWTWAPRGMEPGWRPYTMGAWVPTMAGWTWGSEWVWGWVPFHYGRWTYDPAWGWLWVPGRTWGPGWVAWRYGARYVGWAPLPVGAAWEERAGLSLRGEALAEDIPVHGWSFVPQARFGLERQPAYLQPAARNSTLLALSRDFTRFESSATGVVDQGINPQLIARSQRLELRVYPLRDLTAIPTKPLFRPTRDFAVYRPATPPAVDAPETLPQVTAAELARRQAAERTALENWVEATRKRLQTLQDNELYNRSVLTPQAKALFERRHADEWRAFEQEVARARQLLAERHAREEGGAQRRR